MAARYATQNSLSSGSAGVVQVCGALARGRYLSVWPERQQRINPIKPAGAASCRCKPTVVVDSDRRMAASGITQYNLILVMPHEGARADSGRVCGGESVEVLDESGNLVSCRRDCLTEVVSPVLALTAEREDTQQGLLSAASDEFALPRRGRNCLFDERVRTLRRTRLTRRSRPLAPPRSRRPTSTVRQRSMVQLPSGAVPK